jgi:hypothetical protein
MLSRPASTARRGYQAPRQRVLPQNLTSAAATIYQDGERRDVPPIRWLLPQEKCWRERLKSLRPAALLPNSRQIAPKARPEHSSGKQRY